MKIFKWVMIVLCLTLTSTVAGAEEVMLINGDKITGVVIEDNGTEVVIMTEAMGEVSVLKAYVQEEEVPAPEPVVFKEKSAWLRKVLLGYSQSGGNTQKSQMNFNVTASKKTDDDEWSFKGDAHYSSADKQMDAKKFYGMGRYAYNFGDYSKWYHFYKLEGEQDRFANVDYRVIPSTGIGYWFSDEDDFKLMAEGAVGYEYTNYRDNTKSTGEAVLIPRAFVEKKFKNNVVVSQEVVLYPSLKDTGEYRMHSETSVSSPISDQLSLKFSFIDDFDSDPQGNTKKNDYRLVSGLEYQF